jgi:selenocysteine lyase/cysteine desulfurase
MYVREEVCAKLKPRLVGALSTADRIHFLNYDLTPHPGALRFLMGTPNILGVAGMIETMTLLNELTRDAIDRHTTRLAARALFMAQERGYELTTTLGEHGPIATFKSKLGRDETHTFLQKLNQEAGVVVARHFDRQGSTHLRMSFHCYNTEEEIVRAFEALDKIYSVG